MSEKFEYHPPRKPKPGEVIITIDRMSPDGEFSRSGSKITWKEGVPYEDLVLDELESLFALMRHEAIKAINMVKFKEEKSSE